MRALVTLLMIGMTLSGCASVPGGFSIEAPDWSPGHSWTYTHEYAYHVASNKETTDSQGVGDEPTTYTVLRNQSVDQQAGWLVGVEGDYMDVPGMPYGPAIWVRPWDLRAAGVWDLVSMRCDYEFCEEDINAYPDIDDGQHGRFLEFPLQAGTTWTYGTELASYQAEVIGAEPVETGMGEMKAAHIRFTMDQSNFDDEAADYEDWGATVYKYDVVWTQTVDVYYVPDVEWYGRIDVAQEVTFDIDVQWEEGERETEQGTATMTESAILDDYVLAVEPPATDDEIIELLGTNDLFPYHYDDPYVAPEAANVTVTLTGPEEVNIAQDDEATLRVETSGDNPPYTHQWLVTGPGEYGSYYDFEDGDTEFTADLEQLGQYLVAVRTYDGNGTYVSYDTLEFEGYYMDAVEGTCSASVQIAAIGSCDVIDFPINTWWNVDVTLTGDYAGGVLDDGYLELMDPYGNVQVKKDLSNGHAKISGEFWDSGLWTGRVVPATGGDDGEPVSYTVELRSSEEAWLYSYY